MLIAGLTLGAFAVIAAAVFAGAMAQRLSGQAYGMIASPVVAFVAPQHVPAALLILGFFVGAGSLSMDLSAVNWKEAGPGFAGRAVGGFAGAALAASLADPSAVSVAVAVIVLVSVALTLSGFSLPIRPATLACAGFAAGIMGTLTAIGAPPMAILYAQEEARRSRAMQNLFFGWGMIWSIGALAAVGLIHVADLILVAALLPVAGAALLAARPVARALEGRSIRPVALTLAVCAALAILARAAM